MIKTSVPGEHRHADTRERSRRGRFGSRGLPSVLAVSPGGIGKEEEAVSERRVIAARVTDTVQWVTLKVAQDSNRKRPVSRTGVGEVLSETAHLVGGSPRWRPTKARAKENRHEVVVAAAPRSAVALEAASTGLPRRRYPRARS